MNETPSVPAPADKPKKVAVSDEELLNIAFTEFCAIIAKHGGHVDVGQLLDKRQRFMVFITGIERVEKPGSPTVTFKFNQVSQKGIDNAKNS